MSDHAERAAAIVGLAAILPDAPDAGAFWENVRAGRSSISEVPAGRWSIADYYDPDPAAPDKTYSRIGGWVRGFTFDWKRFHIPPRVAAAMDEGQQWAVTVAANALADYGHPQRPLDHERTGVVLGAAMGGELHYLTTLRICFPEYVRALESVPEFRDLPGEVRRALLEHWHEALGRALPAITEDSMPGELPNILSGRVANVLDLHGPNFITDAACASTFAAVDAAMDLLDERQCDAVVTGGVDRNMGVSSFVKFCKIGALSATGTRPFGDGADGFVMGEGAAAFLLKRLADAERDGDRIYAVVRGVGAASDGHGKGITAPNPVGQRLAMQRAWDDAGLDPATAGLVEAHGTSTRVGDVVEVESLAAVFGNGRAGSIGLGSVKSNVGHLKAAAGAAGLLKAVFALRDKVLPPTLNARTPNPNIDFAHTPFRLCHDLADWPRPNGDPRRAGVSAYGFGGTNFHVVLEEPVPGLLTGRRTSVTVATPPVPRPVSGAAAVVAAVPRPPSARLPLRGVLALGAETSAALADTVSSALAAARRGVAPAPALPDPAVLAAPERLMVDFGRAADLADRLQKAQQVLAAPAPTAWRALESQGVFRGSGARAGKVAFLFPGQGSQYLNMGRSLRAAEPVVAAAFEEADRVLTPLLGRPLTSFLFVDPASREEEQAAEAALKQTSVTQPAVLALDVAMARLLSTFGMEPDVVMGHSLGEYAALVVAGVLPFADALEAAAARGREMSRVSVADPGRMAAVMAPLAVVEEVLGALGGYAVVANINSTRQCVIGGASETITRAIEAFEARGFQAVPLAVSHAFHTRIVAPASAPLRTVLDRLGVAPPIRPVVGNVTGGFYPTDVSGIKDVLERQIASPVQWLKGLETLYADGVRVFVEVGPKRALKGFVEDVLGGREGVVSLSTNHPRPGDATSFNQALCGLWAAGAVQAQAIAAPPDVSPAKEESVRETRPYDRNDVPQGSVVISGTGLGLPGTDKPVMDPANAERILRGEQFVDLVPAEYRRRLANKHIMRVVKSEDGSGRFEFIEDTADVIKLAGRPGAFDLAAEYGVPEKLVEALDITTQLAMAAGLDALREAGIPLVQTWRPTSTGRHLPDRWLLPEALRDETGVIFASAFPGYNRFADELTRFHEYDRRRRERELLEDLRRCTEDPAALEEIGRRLEAVEEALAREPYAFDRRFLLRVLSMGHSQFAEYIGARGPNAQVNAACAATAQGIALAEDWIRSGRCRRVVIVGADNVTSPQLFEWMGSGFLASGAAATDDKVEEAAVPFDRRRHGLLMGMGACGLVVESQDAVEERGMRGIVELLSTETRNSAFHATRLDVPHIAGTVESLVASAERRFGLSRSAMAPQTVFVSHETFTPARGGSASAEVEALRRVFGSGAGQIVVANTKGFTGHPMGVGIEDVIAVKILEHGIVPPVPNYREEDPDLGRLNLSRGGRYPVRFALHLAAGFGSQVSLTLTRRIPGALDRVDSKPDYERWVAAAAGQDGARTEVVKRVLRVVSSGPPARQPAPATWTFGLGPVRRVAIDGEAAPAAAPAPRVAAPGPRPVAPSPAPEAKPAVAAAVPPAVARTPEPPPAPVFTVKGAAVPPPASAAVPAPAPDAVTQTVLGIVAGKTGYPAEMLELDLDLEADLGVDTVKQAETFAAIREAYAIPRQETLKLRDFPTLRHVVQFVLQHRPELAAARPEGTPEAVAAPAAPVRNVVPDPAPPPPALAIAAPPASMPAPLAPPGDDDVTRTVLGIVAEKTGYPAEMLELDLDLEADLGVDTVKQAETFAAVRAAYSIPRQESLKLRDFPTLRHVVGFVRQHRPDLGATPVQAPAAGAPVAVAPSAPARRESVPIAEAERLPRRVPVPALRPPLDLCKRTGVALAGRCVVIGSDSGGVAAALRSRLEAQGARVLEVSPASSDPAADVRALAAGSPVAGVFWLAALDAEPALLEMDLGAFREANRVRVKSLYELARAIGEEVGRPGGFLISATRMGGLLGAGPRPSTSALGGAVAGFTKAFRRERPEALVKVVDFEAAAAAGTVADALLAEALTDPGVVEVGHTDGLRFTVTLVEQAAPSPAPPLGRDSVFLVTGAAGGITSAIVEDLAAAGGTFYLLDLAPLPPPGDRNVELLRAGREGLKQALIDEARARGEKALPPAIEKRIFDVERQEAALRAREAVEAAGGTAIYRQVDLRDGQAVAAIAAELGQRHRRLDVLLHAGGLEVSRELAQKERAEFDRVFDVKSDGFFNVLRATRGMPVGVVVAFSSVAGRFGNAGQTDYSAANGLLCSIASHLRGTRPQTRFVAIDWTAWGGIGMATRGSIPKVMELAGIDMMPPEVGFATVRREIAAGSGEVVVAGRLGVMGAEWDESGGLDVERANTILAEGALPMIGRVTGARVQGGLEIETTLDPQKQPFLFDHALEGTPLLPGVMATEAFAEAASLLAPGWSVLAIEDEHFDKPFKFYRGQPASFRLTVWATPDEDGVVVMGRLTSRVQPRPELAAMEKEHFSARVRMSRQAPPVRKADFVPPAAGLDIGREAIYRVYFHGPSYRVLHAAAVQAQTALGLMEPGLPADTDPPARLLTEPRLVELCFQTAGLWEIVKEKRLALPQSLRSLRILGHASEAEGGLWALVTRQRDGAFTARVVDEAGRVFVELDDYRTVTLEGRSLAA